MAYSLGFLLQINEYCVSNPWPLTDSFLYGKHTRAETPDGERRGECGEHRIIKWSHLDRDGHLPGIVDHSVGSELLKQWEQSRRRF